MLMLILIIELGTYYFEYQRSIQYDLDSVKQLTCSACIKLSVSLHFPVFHNDDNLAAFEVIGTSIHSQYEYQQLDSNTPS